MLSAILSGASLVVGNCESPVVRKPAATVGTQLGTRHAMTRSFLEGVLDAAGIDPSKLVLSVANNHVLDQGAAGFEETVATLQDMGIRVIGAVGGLRLVRAKVEALTVGFSAFTQWRNAGQAAFAAHVTMDPDDWLHGDREGIDLLVAVPHWDREFRHFPQAATREIARHFTEQGFSLIAGHHAHVVQAMERIGDAVVAYGLGDLLGTVFTRQPWPGRIGAVLIADVSTDLATRGRIAAYRMEFFYRLREGARERLIPVEMLDEPMRSRIAGRLTAIYGMA